MTPPDDWAELREKILHVWELADAEGLPNELGPNMAMKLLNLGDALMVEIARLREREAQANEKQRVLWRRWQDEIGERRAAEARVAELIHERNAHHERAERAEARVAELDAMLIASEEHTQFHEARVQELEAENRGLLFNNEERETFNAALARGARLEEALREIAEPYSENHREIARSALAHEEEA